jgi:hypothetical protein
MSSRGSPGPCLRSHPRRCCSLSFSGLSFGVWIAGLQFAVEWGVIAFALNYIPFIGPFIATLFPTLLAMTQFSTWKAPVEGEHEHYGILTTDANAVVAPIHPQAMPVILASQAEVDLWLEAETLAALSLQRPLPNEALAVVAKGEKEDVRPPP